MGALVAIKTMHGARKLRKAFEIAAFFEQRTVHAGRKAHHFGVVFITVARDQVFEAGDDALERAAAAVETVNCRYR